MTTRLTPKILLSHGFVELEEKDPLDRPIYSLKQAINKYGSYPFDIHVVLEPEYPDSNPNSGIVSIYAPEFSYTTVPEDLTFEEFWTDEDQKRVDDNVSVAPAFKQPIAWHVTTYERLRSIVESLTLTTLEYGK
jgi:hypothetical protein